MRKLEEFTEDEFNKLQSTGMMWEFYPDAPLNYSDLKTLQKPEPLENIDFSKLINSCKSLVNNIDSNPFREYADDKYCIYEEAMRTIFGGKYFEWHNNKVK